MTQLPTPLDRVATAGHLLYGDRWQSNLARDLDVSLRALQSWFADPSSSSRRTMPSGIISEVEALVRRRADECAAWLATA